jgi:uncharacterized protein
MRSVVHADLAAYAGRVLPWLNREPIVHNALSSGIEARANGVMAAEPGCLWLHTEDASGQTSGVAVVTPPRGLFLSLMPEVAAKAVAAHMATLRPDLPSADGPVGPTQSFVDEFAKKTGARASQGRASRMFQLDQVTAPVGVPGKARAATRQDRDLLVAWAAAFDRDTGTAMRNPAEPVDARLKGERLLWLWEVAGEPVSMAWLAPPVVGVSRISGVYTPAERRGHGYASAVVARTSQHALESGSALCMLYTDLANPISNRIYQRIGYRPVADAQEWRFTGSEQPAG